MDFHELKVMKIGELRDVAKDVEGFAGYTQMNKEQLLTALCNHLNIPMYEHHEIVGLDKTAVKARIRDLKQAREDALEARDSKELARVRGEIHKLNESSDAPRSEGPLRRP